MNELKAAFTLATFTEAKRNQGKTQTDIYEGYLPWLLGQYQKQLGLFLVTQGAKASTQHHKNLKVAGDKGISEMKSKQQSPCSNCMNRPVTSLCIACSTYMHKPVRCMHWPVMSQANACIYCVRS